MKAQETNSALTVLTTDQANVQISDTGRVAFHSLGDVASFAVILQQSGLLPVGMDAKKATGNMIAGMQIGLTPWQSIQSMANVNGKPTVYGDAVIGLCLASGLLTNQKTEYFKDKSGKDFACRYTCWRKGMSEPVSGEFSMQMAQQADLLGHTGWKNYPRRMLKMRARALALRDAFADILGGIRIREEEEDTPIEIPPESVRVSPSPAEKPNLGEALERVNAESEVIDTGSAEPTPAPEKKDDKVTAEEMLNLEG